MHIMLWTASLDSIFILNVLASLDHREGNMWNTKQNSLKNYIKKSCRKSTDLLQNALYINTQPKYYTTSADFPSLLHDILWRNWDDLIAKRLMFFLVFGFSHDVWMRLADDVLEYLVGSIFWWNEKILITVKDWILGLFRYCGNQGEWCGHSKYSL